MCRMVLRKQIVYSDVIIGASSVNFDVWHNTFNAYVRLLGLCQMACHAGRDCRYVVVL